LDDVVEFWLKLCIWWPVFNHVQGSCVGLEGRTEPPGQNHP